MYAACQARKCEIMLIYNSPHASRCSVHLRAWTRVRQPFKFKSHSGCVLAHSETAFNTCKLGVCAHVEELARQKLFHKTGAAAASYYIAGRVYYDALAIVGHALLLRVAKSGKSTREMRLAVTGWMAGRAAPAVYMLVCSEFGPFCDIPGTDLLLQPRRQAMYSLRISDSVCERVSAGVGEFSAWETETSLCKYFLLWHNFFTQSSVFNLSTYIINKIWKKSC